MMNQSKYLSGKALASEWNISYRTLENWRSTGFGPVYIRIGGCIRYRPDEVRAFEATPEFAARMAYIKRRRGQS